MVAQRGVHKLVRHLLQHKRVEGVAGEEEDDDGEGGEDEQTPALAKGLPRVAQPEPNVALVVPQRNAVVKVHIQPLHRPRI